MGVSGFVVVSHGLSQQHTLQQRRLALQGHTAGAQMCPQQMPEPSRALPTPALTPWFLTFSPLAPGGPAMAWGREWAGEQGYSGMLPLILARSSGQGSSALTCPGAPASPGSPLGPAGPEGPGKPWHKQHSPQP